MQIKDFNLKINQQLLLDNVSMSFANQKLNLIIGRNGVGKTLLLDLISDLDHNRPENFHDFPKNSRIIYCRGHCKRYNNFNWRFVRG